MNHSNRVPTHVAVIMDGNGRWATVRGLPRTEGHRAGAKAVRAVVTRARERGVRYLTLYAFSSQNWRRPTSEVAELMGLLVQFCRKERKLLLDKGIRFRLIGERARIPTATRRAAELLEKLTEAGGAMELLVAVSYGGREEIVEAARTLARDVLAGRLSPEAIDEAEFARRLWTRDVPDPDLIIRTSGELRLSNFLLWQAAYTELYVDDRLWPDFDSAAFDAALEAFGTRERRFGGVDASGT